MNDAVAIGARQMNRVVAAECARRVPSLAACQPEGQFGHGEVVPVCLEPSLRAALAECADADHTSVSDVIREALRNYLDVA